MAHNDEPLRPVFTFLEPVSEHVLSKSTVRVAIAGKTYDGEGMLVMRTLPSPTIALHADLTGVPQKELFEACWDSDLIERVDFNGRPVPGFAGGFSGSLSGSSQQLTWFPSTEPIIGIGDQATDIDHIIFHLFNFRDFHNPNGLSERRGDCARAISRVVLESADISVVISSLYETHDIQRELRREGGTRLTHVGRLSRSDGLPVKGDQALEYLKHLAKFLSFANGTNCAPVSACGFNDQKESVWEAWSSPSRAGAWSDSWFDTHHSDQLVNSFACYMRTAEDSVWKDALDEAIYWYVNANQSVRGIDAGIILTQTALERLAYTYAVQHKQLISKKGFIDLRASDKLRLFFSSVGIPTKIPAECSDLIRLLAAPKNNLGWVDLPHALTDIRNSLVHPDKNDRGKYSDGYYDAWRAGLWLLELSVLAICGYKGTYSNRLTSRRAGQSETVPWR